jgi:copper(I)-binding protein
MAGGTLVSITGDNFDAGATVSFGDALARSVTVKGSTEMTAITPGSSAGAVSLTVTNSDGQSATLAGAFTFLSPPRLSGISPVSGPTTGGTPVTLTGTGFLAGATVTFGSAAASSVVVVSSTRMTAITPASSAGAVSVTVTNGDGQSGTLAGAFTFLSPPSLSGISPASGPITGGTPVTLTGTGFLAGATATFGSAAASSVVVVNSTQMTAITPAFSAGAVSVTVTNSDSQSATLAGAFTFVSPPAAICALTLPDGNPSVPYYATLTCPGGTPSYTWTLFAGTLPSGLTLNSSTGLISGTPTEATAASFTAQATDSSTPTPQTVQVKATLNVVTPAASDPELPQLFMDTTFPNTSGYITRTVCASGCNYNTLQAALSDVHNQGGDAAGEIIELASGATFTENDTLPAYTMAAGKWVIVATNTASSNLPAAGVRITPEYSPTNGGPLAQILSANQNPVFQTASNANYYWFVGVEIGVTGSVGENYGVFVVGNGETTPAALPNHIVLDRCYVHGNATGGIRRGLAANGAYVAAINSYFENFHDTAQDTQAIAAWNSPGPVKIANNFLEGAAENVLFGGVDPSVTNLVNSDLEIRQNHFFKPLSWNPYDPSYAGTLWSVKDLFELKNAQRVLVEGNILENNWVQAQDGFGVLFTPRNQEGNCPWCAVANVTFRYNIFQHSASGFNISAADSASPCGDGSGPSLPATGILISNDLLRDMSSAAEWGSASETLFQFLNGPDSCTASQIAPPANVIINHVTAFQDGHTAFAGDNYSDNPMPGVGWENSLLAEGAYGFLGTSTAEGNATFAAYFTSPVFTANVLEGGWAGNYNSFSGDFFPTSWSTALFSDQTDCLGGTFSVTACALQAASPYHDAATDGKDIGADIDALNAATTGVSP